MLSWLPSQPPVFLAWFAGAWAELVHYFDNLSTMQWGYISAAAVAFGFLCLKGTGR